MTAAVTVFSAFRRRGSPARQHLDEPVDESREGGAVGVVIGVELADRQRRRTGV